jgi:RNA recognition motif-containing protein
MGKQLYVTNISFQATEDDLRRLFTVAGTVKTIKMLTDDKTGKFRGCGFVEMANAAEAKEAVESLDDALLLDRQITVVEARPPEPKAKPAGGWPGHAGERAVRPGRPSRPGGASGAGGTDKTRRPGGGNRSGKH